MQARDPAPPGESHFPVAGGGWWTVVRRRGSLQPRVCAAGQGARGAAAWARTSSAAVCLVHFREAHSERRLLACPWSDRCPGLGFGLSRQNGCSGECREPELAEAREVDKCGMQRDAIFPVSHTIFCNKEQHSQTSQLSAPRACRGALCAHCRRDASSGMSCTCHASSNSSRFAPRKLSAVLGPRRGCLLYISGFDNLE